MKIIEVPKWLLLMHGNEIDDEKQFDWDTCEYVSNQVNNVKHFTTCFWLRHIA